jgi:cellobiose phosphorylase
MYQLILESFVGLKRKGDTLEFKPCMPADWGVVKVQYKYMDTVYMISLKPGEAKERVIKLENRGGVVEA